MITTPENFIYTDEPDKSLEEWTILLNEIWNNPISPVDGDFIIIGTPKKD